jgi:hypothetical protein
MSLVLDRNLNSKGNKNLKWQFDGYKDKKSEILFGIVTIDRRGKSSLTLYNILYTMN